jgi:uncharacterized membrane protein
MVVKLPLYDGVSGMHVLRTYCHNQNNAKARKVLQFQSSASAFPLILQKLLAPLLYHNIYLITFSKFIARVVTSCSLIILLLLVSCQTTRYFQYNKSEGTTDDSSFWQGLFDILP